MALPTVKTSAAGSKHKARWDARADAKLAAKKARRVEDKKACSY